MPAIHTNTKNSRRKKRMASLREGVASTEFYLGKSYAKENDEGSEYYAKDSNQNEFYLADDNLRHIRYAIKRDNNEEVEFEAKTAEGKITYMLKDEEIVYPKNLSLNIPIFPVVDNAKAYIMYEGKERYALDPEGNPIYLKDSNNHIIFAKDNDKPYYGRNHNNDEVYPKDGNNNEFYLTFDDTDVGARKASGEYYYAKDKNKREIYPRKVKEVMIENVDVRVVNNLSEDENMEEDDGFPHLDGGNVGRIWPEGKRDSD